MKVIFVGMHNKTGMMALDSKTRTGKIIDRIVEKVSATCIKTNLCNINYLPKDKKLILLSNLEWKNTHRPNSNVTVVLLGDWVQKNFLLTEVKIVKIPHPASIFGIKNKERYILDVVEKIKRCCI